MVCQPTHPDASDKEKLTLRREKEEALAEIDSEKHIYESDYLLPRHSASHGVSKSSLYH